MNCTYRGSAICGSHVIVSPSSLVDLTPELNQQSNLSGKTSLQVIKLVGASSILTMAIDLAYNADEIQNCHLQFTSNHMKMQPQTAPNTHS